MLVSPLCGHQIIEDVWKTLPSKPGVYRMYNVRGNVLYVGKAKNLKKRVAYYLKTEGLSKRIQRMVYETNRMEIVVTHTEAEALLLEANLIKKLNPPYNILFKDGKSMAYILIAKEEWPLLLKHRGALPPHSIAFGPFISAQAINQALKDLQRLFLLRSCTASFFKSRTRPCLLYHVKRCSAPCVNKISKPDYENLLLQAEQFLSGKSTAVQSCLAKEMEDWSKQQEYEKAAIIRERIQVLTHIQMNQSLHLQGLENVDVMAIAHSGGTACIQLFSFRHNMRCGASAFCPKHDLTDSRGDILQAFLMQFYQETTPPPFILLSEPIPDQKAVAQALQKTGVTTTLQVPQRGPKRIVILKALENAQEALERHQKQTVTVQKNLDHIAMIFGLPAPPKRIEVYDNSHLQGTHAIGAMIVSGPEGFVKHSYRKFMIQKTPGDDFGMMKEVFSRRFPSNGQAIDLGPIPDLIIIDGGKGQLSCVVDVLESHNYFIPVIAMAKGRERNAGNETFFMKGKNPIKLNSHDPILYYLQQLRDEAHRYVIMAHRKKRIQALQKSGLNHIVGIGPTRKRALLRHFGSVDNIRSASIQDLQTVEGIRSSIAKKIYEHFQSNA